MPSVSGDAGEGKPSFVRGLEQHGLEVLIWGGDDAAGMVEWGSKDEDGTPIRNCRRWHTIFGRELGHHVLMTERDIVASGGLAWAELMRKSGLEFQESIRREQRERGARAARRR